MKGIRTPDLSNSIAALSQLSYTPAGAARNPMLHTAMLKMKLERE
jgi:hypothetical protein